MTKIVNIKGEHDQSLQEAKTKSNGLKKEIEKLKTQVNAKVDKKIVELEAKVAATKKSFDNVNDDNMVLFKIIKIFQKDLLEQMIQRLISLNELYKLKEQTKVELQDDVAATTIHKGSLSILRLEVEDLHA